MRSVGEKPWRAHGRGLKTEAWGGLQSAAWRFNAKTPALKQKNFVKVLCKTFFLA